MNSLNIDTSSSAKTGMFGAKLLAFGACQIGQSFWIKNGLTLQDKLVFETYQEMCDECTDLALMEEYEEMTSQEHKDKIIETLVEINSWYEIGNEHINP